MPFCVIFRNRRVRLFLAPSGNNLQTSPAFGGKNVKDLCYCLLYGLEVVVGAYSMVQTLANQWNLSQDKVDKIFQSSHSWLYCLFFTSSKHNVSPVAMCSILWRLPSIPGTLIDLQDCTFKRVMQLQWGVDRRCGSALHRRDMDEGCPGWLELTGEIIWPGG